MQCLEGSQQGPHPPPLPSCLSSWKSYKHLNKTVPWNNGQTTDPFVLVASYAVRTSLQNSLWHPPLIHTYYETLPFLKELIKRQENKVELTTPIEKTSLLTEGRPPDCTSAGWYARVPYNFVVVCSRVMCVWRLVLLSALCAVACWACPRSLILASICLSSKMLALSDRNVTVNITSFGKESSSTRCQLFHLARRVRLPFTILHPGKKKVFRKYQTPFYVGIYIYIYIRNWLKFMLCPWLCIVNIITRPFLKML